MRELLQAIRDKVVPHNMSEDLYAVDTPWYDNCLIVEVHDYRSSGVKPKDDTNSTGEGGTNAFSIHNYNNFITPSPFAPFPSSKPESKPTQADAQVKDAENKEDKENMPAPGQAGALQKQPARAKVTTVVLFPTPQSHITDIQLLATTPVPDMATLKRMQAAGRAAGMPPTPLTAVPPTPTFPTGPSPKRQKMVLDDSNVHEFEAEVYNATCPKLYLEPTKSLGESLALMDAMTHPNNKNPAPTRKARKRTTAELAADEADAATLQRFMLAGDEYQATMASTASGNDDGAVRAAANSQTFSRFKTLATIKANHEEADRRKKEEDARVAQAKRQAQAEAEAQKRRDMEASRQQAELLERQQQLLRQQAQQQAQLQQNQTQQNEALRAATHAQQMSNAAAAQNLQTPQSATQTHFSPVVRQQTPMTVAAASPRVGGQSSHPMGGTPMVATASNHAIASPARPPSAVSHHPMARIVSQQQNISRTGTPQMIQGTPVMNPSMPNRNMTPTPSRINQSSPSIQMQGQTPMINLTPQPGQNMTPEQMQQFQNQQQMQRMRMQQMQQQQGMSPGNQQLQQVAIQKATMHIQSQGVPQGQNAQNYRQQLAQQYFRQLQQQQQQQQQQHQQQQQQQQQHQQQQQQQHQQQQQQQQQHQQQQQQQGQQQQQQAMQNMSPQGGIPQGGMPPQQGTNMANMSIQQMRQQYNQRKAHLLQTYGGQNVPQQYIQQMQQLELAIKTRETQAQQHQMQQVNPGIQGQMQNQMNGMQNVQNPIQMQQYQQMLQQQRANQARQQQMMAMRQQAMQAGGQIPQGMMNNMQGMNMGQMNMGNVNNMQGMNMAQMQAMQQGMGGVQGAQGMQGMNMGQMNQQQMQQMMMMRQAQQQAQRMGQQGQQQGGDMGWSGV